MINRHTLIKVLLTLICTTPHQVQALTPEQKAYLSVPAVVESHVRYGKERQLSYTSQLVETIEGIGTAFSVWASESSCGKANVVIDYSYDDYDQFSTTVKKIVEYMQQRQNAFAWYVYSSKIDNSTEVRKALTSCGFTSYIPFGAMICFLDELQPTTPLDFFSCTAITNEKEITTWLDIAHTSFNHDLPLRDAYERQIAKALNDGDEKYFIGYYNNEPVSIGLLIINRSENYAIIQNIATKHAFRRQGFAEALTRCILQEAQVMGLTHAVLTSTQQAEKIYERVGFKKISTIDIYVSQS